MKHAISFAPALLRWYDQTTVSLPWRAGCDPYPVAVSEIMLQQTTVATVIPYYHRFMQRFPTVQSLAESSLDEVLALWQGLGYYRRAVSLHKMAQTLVFEHQGRWPQDVDGLKKLSGIGDYTAGAIAAIAFGRSALALDGNGVRVFARVMGFCAPVSSQTSELRDFARQRVPSDRPGDFWQAIMDLGRTVCRPKNPICSLCPVRDYCVAFAAGQVDVIPAAPIKVARPHRVGQAFVLTKGDQVWLRRRPSYGLLAHLSEPPSFGWESDVSFNANEWWRDCGVIRHVFTHFSLDIQVFHNETLPSPFDEGDWHPRADLPPLSTLAKKMLRAASFLVD